MATVNLFADGEGATNNGFVKTGASTWWECIKDYDAGSIYMYNFANSGDHRTFSYDAMPATDGNTVTLSNIYVYRRQSHALSCGNSRGISYFSATYYYGSYTGATTSWVQYDMTTASLPTLYASTIDAGYPGGVQTDTTGNSARTRSFERIYCVITYTPPPGLVVVTWSLPFIGVITSASQWLQAMNWSRWVELGRKHAGMNYFTYTRKELERLQKDFRDSLRGYAFVGRHAWLSA